MHKYPLSENLGPNVFMLLFFVSKKKKDTYFNQPYIQFTELIIL